MKLWKKEAYEVAREYSQKIQKLQIFFTLLCFDLISVRFTESVTFPKLCMNVFLHSVQFINRKPNTVKLLFFGNLDMPGVVW